MREAAGIKRRIAAIPLWHGDIRVALLKGGISNESYVVEDDTGKYVVRFGKDYPFHHVFRNREAMTARAAHQAGFAPELFYAGEGVMVTAFLGARTYGADDVRANIPRVAELIRRFHTAMPENILGPGFMFWVFHVIRDYARTLRAGNSRMVPHLGTYLAIAAEMEAVQKPLPIIFSHNDLLPANILDDGSRLWLIDFEYAGFSTSMFDLAGLASNAGLDDEESEALLAAYFHAAPDAELKRAHAAMQCASLLREAMWSMVSELHLHAPGVDYIAYTDENLLKLDQALDQYRSRYGK
ncbi:choline/ethanolamine kinase family protein [Phyllobacterium endophyticum]|uniref:Choline kinase n=1 Tax=Phyllobacterium endophyticum TaxID=1149773 RepID=A0A2P7AYW9_9HYPH|nr:choline/ethanolamine kinase family protein [Phyllobacterium endophyticum]MBB3236038.1 thiamine kinase-like enzyme [Phyllobacterium endophyticum]PSH59393.1 choline kinase [Phyllobacterium endophyticum]TYR41525.1 phosphotransferase family protein [Phyllobacterium endophyticum]